MLSGLTGPQGTSEKPPGEVSYWVCFIILNSIVKYFENIFYFFISYDHCHLYIGKNHLTFLSLYYYLKDFFYF